MHRVTLCTKKNSMILQTQFPLSHLDMFTTFYNTQIGDVTTAHKTNEILFPF